MYFYELVGQALQERGLPLLTEYEFFLVIEEAYRHQRDRPGLVRNPPRTFDPPVFRRTLRQLARKRQTVLDPDFRGEVWQILSAPPAATAEDAICLVDPFARVAYLSALERYGLTNRSPKALQILTYGSPQWGMRRRELLRSELPPELIGKDFPVPVHVRHKNVVRRRPVDLHTATRLGAVQKIRGTYARISAISQTFIDTLESPQLCGGMRHVLQIWDEHAKSYLDEIISAVNAQDVQQITKVRAGYILTERLGVRSKVASAWVRFAQRGGSRKLDPQADFAPTYSERWMLSINV